MPASPSEWLLPPLPAIDTVVSSAFAAGSSNQSLPGQATNNIGRNPPIPPSRGRTQTRREWSTANSRSWHAMEQSWRDHWSSYSSQARARAHRQPSEAPGEASDANSQASDASDFASADDWNGERRSVAMSASEEAGWDQIEARMQEQVIAESETSSMMRHMEAQVSSDEQTDGAEADDAWAEMDSMNLRQQQDGLHAHMDSYRVMLNDLFTELPRPHIRAPPVWSRWSDSPAHPRDDIRRPPPLPNIAEESAREVWPLTAASFEIFMCPITHDVLRDPVSTLDGYTYERQAIEEWFRTSSKSPVTGQILPTTQLIPNQSVRTLLRTLIDIAEGETAHGHGQNKLSGEISESGESNDMVQAGSDTGAAMSTAQSSMARAESHHVVDPAAQFHTHGSCGVAKADFDGSLYGESYLIFSSGDRLRRFPHVEEGEGWAWGRIENASWHFGWFPETFLQEDLTEVIEV